MNMEQKYAIEFGNFLKSLDVKEEWDAGKLVPCENCYGEGVIPVMRGNAIKEYSCDTCDGTGYVMEDDND